MGNQVKHLLILISILLFSLTNISCSSSDSGSSTTSTTSDNDSTTDDNSTYSDNGTTFTVTVSSSKYYIDGILTKSLTLKKGYTYFLIPLIQPQIVILYLLAQSLLEEVIPTNILLV